LPRHELTPGSFLVSALGWGACSEKDLRVSRNRRSVGPADETAVRITV
jgi:hypothetical protein